jgi:hypothetical protein
MGSGGDTFMQQLADSVFGKITVSQSLIDEFYERNTRKAADDKWLKANKPAILNAMNELGKTKSDFGDIRITVSTPDESRFDMEKIVEFLANDVPEGIFHQCTKVVVDEAALMDAIEHGKIDLGTLKQFAWIERTGTPRISVKKL